MTVQLPAMEASPTPQSLQFLLDNMNGAEAFQRRCECCGKETVWNRREVMDRFPEVLCVRVNRFIIDMATYSVKKNTV